MVKWRVKRDLMRLIFPTIFCVILLARAAPLLAGEARPTTAPTSQAAEVDDEIRHLMESLGA